MTPILYARLIAGFPAEVAPATVDAVIALARALGAPLYAVLLEDLESRALAELPSARAFDLRAAGWRDLHRADLDQALQLAHGVLTRRLEAARHAGVQAQMATRPGSAMALGDYAQADDLLVVTEPSEPMARWTQPFCGLLAAALATPAALLYLPQRGERGRGPIVAFGSPAVIELAQRLARALGAPMVEAAALPAAPPSLPAMLPSLHAQRARVVVCARAALGSDPQPILRQAADRRLAVLLPPETLPA